MNQRETLKINSKGHLEIGGCDAVDLAKNFGTPLYVFDEKYIRDMMRVYRDTIEKEYGGNGLVLYASKAFSCMAIYRIAAQENIGVDVVSGGELYTAIKAGFPAEKIYMHGNNKLLRELEFAVDAGVGTIVVDSYDEADMLDDIAKAKGVEQNVLIRINPGVEAHTHAFVQTARTDSKFGFSISDGTAEKMSAYILKKKYLNLKGYHCHIGSQIFEKQSFVLAAQKAMDFMAMIKSDLGFEADTLNIGGGFGIWYTDDDAKISVDGYAAYLEALISAVKEKSSELGLKQPYLLIEPGRSIVGEAGITLYTVGAIKDIPGIKKYVAIDGGMFDNPRYALYQSKYTVLLANRANEACTEKVTIAGKCCESGDLIAVDVPLPEARRGDIAAVLSTGAYNYSMASNYNRNFIPPAILVHGGKAEYIVKPQTYDDLVRNDVVPDYLKQ
ncbi:MAG TPA: diaminopimelate decarboxylase [Candidatus Coproplasma stercoripullorum]|uniref:Diaminopimelate decarboxylase n=1 Tax=Candidatus Coproplasma stercoripullorum TaxID=2840751 RepID=A0A9D1DAS4_9FIRM|nr:diaminopimelate decarboxylase [Candidatus Coproplasma stercoripullorum]